MIATDVFDHLFDEIIINIEFKKARSYNPRLQNSTMTFDAAND